MAAASGLRGVSLGFTRPRNPVGNRPLHCRRPAESDASFETPGAIVRNP